MDRTFELTSRFALIDTNSNGSLEKSELASVFGEHAQEFLKFCDGDNDGSLTSDEFVKGILGDTSEMSDEDFTSTWLERMSTCIADAKPKAADAKRVLMVFTSHSKLGDTDQATGWYLPEAAHPHAVFTEAGCNITLASIQGGEPPLDMDSLDAFKEDAVCVKFHEDKVASDTVKIDDCKAADFDAIFLVGGFGVMWDFPDNEHLQALCKDIYEAGGVVSAVCHGPCGLVNVKLSDGSLLIAGKKVTAFTNEEEDAVSRRDVVPWTNQDKMTEVGAEFVDGGAWADNTVVEGKLITGQNPPSAGSCAKAVCQAMA